MNEHPPTSGAQAPEVRLVEASPLTCAQALVRLLEVYGFDLVFGIPGLHTLPLYRALGGSTLHHVTPRHEEGAGFMADGYARITGKPAVCFIVSGPGVTNIATAMGQAFEDSSPMLVISAVAATRDLGMGRGRLHELRDQQALVSQVAAFSHTLMDPSQLPEVMARAMTVFTSQRPRPVHIEIPLDVAERPAAFRPEAWTLANRPGPSSRVTSEALSLLATASTPVIVVGGGAKDAASQVTAFAEALDAPVVTTINGKGVIRPDHPLSLGTSLSFEGTQRMVSEADVVVAIGTDLQEFYPTSRLADIKGRVIRIDIEASQLARELRPTVAILSDAGQALDALMSGLGEPSQMPSRASDGPDRAARTRRVSRTQRATRFGHYEHFLSAVQNAMPEAIIVGDSTAPIYAADHCLEVRAPRTYITASTGYGTLGFGLPAAIGAKLGASERDVVCIAGDGGFQFTLQELTTAVENRLSFPVIIWHNDGYDEIRNMFDRLEISHVGVDVCSPDYIAMAEAMGCQAARVNSLEHLQELLGGFTATDVPLVLEARQESILGE